MKKYHLLFLGTFCLFLTLTADTTNLGEENPVEIEMVSERIRLSSLTRFGVLNS